MNDGMIQEKIKHPWADINSIMIIACCGKNQAYKIKNRILQKLEDKGTPMFDKRYIPTELLLKEINFNRKYFMEMNNE